jgi:hypothetical protein
MDLASRYGGGIRQSVIVMAWALAGGRAPRMSVQPASAQSNGARPLFSMKAAAIHTLHPGREAQPRQ